MGSIAGNSLDLIRTVFSRNNVLPLPSTYWDAAARGAFFMQQGFPGITTGGSNGHLADAVRLEEDLMNRYQDYDEMDQFPELGSAIDLFADDATVQDVMTGKSIWFEAEDETVDHILNDMVEVNLKLENELWEIARSLCKYGNEFIEPIVLDNVGVVKLSHIPCPWMRRIEDMNGILYGFMQDPATQFTIDTRTFLERIKNKSSSQLEIPTSMTSNYLQVYEPWEIVHMRLRSKARRDLYGFSVVEAARYAWKRLAMMEDAMLMYKVTRSPQRYAFYVDVGDVPPNQARGFLNRIKNDFKKTKFIDEKTGKPSFRYSPLSAEDDFFIPVRKDRKGTEIDVLAGPEGQSVEDVEYFLNKVFAALKIPKSYLGADETVGRANLCLVPETMIPLLDGRTLSMEDLIKEYEQGKQNWVYSVDEKNLEIKPGKIIGAEWTRKDAQIVRVYLDNDQFIDCTPDHPFMLRNGSYLRADQLSAGQSLMPYYAKRSKGKMRDYEMIYNPSIQNYSYVHRMVGEYFSEVKKGEVVHHVDFNRHNNNPENLEIMDFKEHFDFHIRSNVAFMRRSESMQKKRVGNLQEWLNSDRAKKIRISNFEKARAPGGGQWLWNKSLAHRDLKRKQMTAQWNNGDFSNWDKTQFREEQGARIKRLMMEGIIKVKGSDNPRWREISFDELGHIALSLNAKCKRDLFIAGYSQCLVDRITGMNGHTFKEFSNKYLGGYKLVRAFDPDMTIEELAQICANNDFKSKTDLQKNGYSKHFINAIMKKNKTTFQDFADQYLGGYKRYRNIDIDPYMSLSELAGLCHENGYKTKNSLKKSISNFMINTIMKNNKTTFEAFAIEHLGGYHRHYKNHKVLKIEFLSEKRDCCDIQIEGSPNFATASGVFVHNSQLDVRLCRSVMRVQRELKNGFRQVGRVDLAAKNIDPDRTSFECHMVIPSGVFELAQIEVEKAKLDLASNYKDAQFSQYWIYSKILGLSDEEILQIQNQRAKENGGGGSQTETAGLVRDQLPRMVDRAANRSDPRADRYQQKILDEIESGNTHLGRKLRELKLLTQEVRGSLKQKRSHGRRR